MKINFLALFVASLFAQAAFASLRACRSMSHLLGGQTISALSQDKFNKTRFTFKMKLIDQLRKKENRTPLEEHLVKKWIEHKVNSVYTQFSWPNEQMLCNFGLADSSGYMPVNRNEFQVSLANSYLKHLNEDALNYVLAHELAHHMQHINKKYSGSRFYGFAKYFMSCANGGASLWLSNALTVLALFNPKFLVPAMIMWAPVLISNAWSRRYELEADTLAIMALKNANGALSQYGHNNVIKHLILLLCSPFMAHPSDLARFINAKRLQKKLLENEAVDQAIYSTDVQVDLDQDSEMLKEANDLMNRFPNGARKEEIV